MSDEITNLKELKALDAQFLKRFPDHYFPVTQKKERVPVEFVSTDCFSLDKVLGAGLAVGRVIEISGSEGSCKSTIGYHCIAAYQKQGKICALIESEAAFNKDYAEALGVDVDKLMILSGCFCMEDYLEGLRLLAKSPVVDLILFDSVSSMTPRRIIEGDVGDATMALQARLWSTHLPEIVPHLASNKITLLLINQLRNTLAMYGPSTSSTGGKALKYYNSVRIEVSKKEVIKDKGKEVGVKVQLKNVKTKVGTPFVTKMLSIYFPKFAGDSGGIDVLTDIVDTALDEGVIGKVNNSTYTWHRFPANKKGESNITGKDNVHLFFKENLSLVDLLKTDLLNNTNHDTTSTQEDSSEEDYEEEAA